MKCHALTYIDREGNDATEYYANQKEALREANIHKKTNALISVKEIEVPIGKTELIHWLNIHARKG